jgi:hypothetical protein
MMPPLWSNTAKIVLAVVVLKSNETGILAGNLAQLLFILPTNQVVVFIHFLEVLTANLKSGMRRLVRMVLWWELNYTKLILTGNETVNSTIKEGKVRKFYGYGLLRCEHVNGLGGYPIKF